jgi:acyl-CoA synthetase (NDP forming)
MSGLIATSTVAVQPVVMTKLLSPKAIAVIGASKHEGTVGFEVLHNLLSGGFQGEVFPVNPKYVHELPETGNGLIQIHPFVASVDQLPEERIDLALIMTPKATVPDALDTLGRKGVRAVVIITAGFQETGREGQRLAEQVKGIADRYGMVVIGPNCLGIANMGPFMRMNATFARSAPSNGRGAIFSQSGAVGIDLMNRASRLGLGIGQFVSLGNELQVGCEQLLAHWETDPDIDYIVGYMESGQALSKLALPADRITRQKPILMIKAGYSQAGAKAASSHTGAMASSREAVDAMLTQSGIQRYDSLDGLFSAIEAFENAAPIRGNRIAIYSNAGGYGVMISDLLEKTSNRLQMASFSPQTDARLAELLPETASKQNPVDTTATFPCDDLTAYEQGVWTLLEDEQVDACIIAIIPLMKLCADEIVEIAARAQMRYRKPVMVVLSDDEANLKAAEKHLETVCLPQIALYKTIEDAVVGLDALERHRLRMAEPADVPQSFKDVERDMVRQVLERASSQNRALLTTAESLQVLEAYGIPSVSHRLATTLEEALAAGKKLGYPLVLKLNSKTISHKTEIGGVVTGIRNEDELVQAWTGLMERLSAHGVLPFQAGEGILMQRFLQGGTELILGATLDPDFGHLLMVGRGGVYTEIDQDFAIRLLPIGRNGVHKMLSKLRIYKALTGFRGKPAVDIEGLETTILRLAQLLGDFPEIQEMDINPLIAMPGASGLAVDARMIVRPAT